MVQQKTKVKVIVLASTLLILILFSNIANFTGYNQLDDKNNTTVLLNEEDNENPKTSNLNLTSYITGKGVNQTVRVYMKNTSKSTDNENGYFNIPAPADNMYLNYGDFRFEFDNNYTTDYIIEEDSALNPATSYFDEYLFDDTTSNLTINEGTPSPIGGYDNIVDGPKSTYWNISSSDIAGVETVDFTVLANFSGVNPEIDLPFNRNNIIGFILNFTQNVYLYGSNNHYAYVSVKIRNFYENEWRTIIDNKEINYTLYQYRNIDKIIINENLASINDSDCTLIRFIYNRTGVSGFNVSLHEFDFKAITVLELPIATDSWVALELDLRGNNSTIIGFHTWIRTLDLDRARYGHLNISLYRANNTMKPTATNLRRVDLLIEPDLSQLLDSKMLDFNAYNDDQLTYFEFDISNTYNLNRSNYYIVITSNVSSGVYSLVTLPATGPHGDTEVDHQIEISNDNGNSWSLARSQLNTRALNTIPLDAHLFKLNITRAYMPSDFQIDGEETLQVQNEEFIDDLVIGYVDAPDLRWGLGVWNHSFTNLIKINTLDNFRVNLTWNMTYIKGFKFDVNYSARAYRIENATTYYLANYDYDPEWIFNYTLDLNKFDIYQWNFTDIWFVYPNYFSAHNLTTPKGIEIYSQIGGESSIADVPGYLKVVISTKIINTSISERPQYDGNYSLYLTGFNAISSTGMYSYLNYNGTLWETNGFMFGDNISISADIQGPINLAPKSGLLNVSLFYPNGTFLSNIESIKGKLSKDKSLLSYDFNNQTILNITKDIPAQGIFYLGYFWKNGSIIGCNKIPIYIDSYDLLLEDCTFDSNADKYLLSGTVELNYSKGYPYGAKMLIARVNETTGKENPEHYPVNTSISIDDGRFSYNHVLTGYEFEVYMSNLKQNETILNPNEKIHIETTIQNRDLYYDLDVRLEVLIVSYINEDWVINSSTSITQNLKKLGQTGDTQIFSVDLTLPSRENDLTWKGVNAPIRQGGAITLIKVYIEDNYAGLYKSEDYSLIIPVEDDIFDAYIVTLKEPISRRQILQHFEKDECSYLPENCTFIVNVINQDYMSSYVLINFSKGLKSPIKFWNITITPEETFEGKIFSISSNLATEFATPLENKEVFCQYYNGDSWKNITSGLTGSNGFINFKVDSSSRIIDASISKLFRLVWYGDALTLNGTKELDVNIIVQTNIISLSSDDDESFIYRNTVSTIEVRLKNRGNSILKILDIDIDIDEDIEYEIQAEDNTILERFISGESTTIIIELEVEDIDSGEIDVKITVTAQNIISGEIIIAVKTIDLDVVNKPFYDYVVEYSSFIILALIALIGIAALLYYRKIKKKLEVSAKEAEIKRPRRGRYVKVSELEIKKPEIEEKEVEKEEEIEEVEVKKKVDLDELLEEELVEKPEEKPIEEIEKPIEEKPPKKVRKPPKKIREIIKKKKKKPKKGRISTRKMVKEKKKAPIKLKKAKKSKSKQKTTTKKEEPKKVKKKKKTDFDSLLEEEGLDNKK